jgi:hypothetical protein
MVERRRRGAGRRGGNRVETGEGNDEECGKTGAPRHRRHQGEFRAIKADDTLQPSLLSVAYAIPLPDGGGQLKAGFPDGGQSAQMQCPSMPITSLADPSLASSADQGVSCFEVRIAVQANRFLIWA